MIEKWNKYKFILIFTIVSLILYWNILLNDFTFDDFRAVVNNHDIKSWGNWFEVLKSVRGVRLITYMVDYSLFGLKPFGYHLHNIFWQILAVLLAYHLSCKLTDNKRAAFIGVLIFAVHPLHVEAVASVANRKEMICFVFYVISFLSYTKLLSSKKLKHKYLWGAVSAFSFLLAFRSKEVAITLPIILIFYEILFVTNNDRLIANKKFFLIIMPVCTTVLYLGYDKFKPFFLINKNIYYSHYLLPGAELTYFHKIYGTVTIFFYYIKHFFVPTSLIAEYTPLSPDAQLNLIFIISILFLTFFLSLMLNRRNRPLAFLLSWVFINYLPVSPLNNAIYPLADRYFYIPSFGLSVAAGIVLSNCIGLASSRRKERIYIAGLAIILLSFSALTVKYNMNWKNNHSLWDYTASKNSSAMYAKFYAAREYMNIEKYEEAEAEILKITDLDPRSRHYKTKNRMLSEIYYFKGDINKAFALFKANTVKIDRFNYNITYSYIFKFAGYLGDHGYIKESLAAYNILLSNNYREKTVLRKIAYYLAAPEERKRLKVEDLKKEIESHPKDLPPRIELGMFYYNNHLYDMAEKALTNAIMINSNLFEAHYNLGLVYEKKGRNDLAVAHFEKARLLKQTVPAVLYDNLGMLYQKMGRPKDAVDQFLMAISTEKEFAISYYHLGFAYLKEGKENMAAEAFRSFLQYWRGDKRYLLLVENELNKLLEK